MKRPRKIKYINNSLDRKTRSRDSFIRGICSLIIGGMIVLLALFVLIPMQSPEGFFIILIPAAVFIVFGVICLKKPDKDLEKSIEMDDRYSEQYNARQTELDISRENYVSKAEKHGGLLNMLYVRELMSKPVFILTWLIFGPLAALAGGIGIRTVVSLFMFLFILILSIWNFLCALFGYKYFTFLRTYKKFGLNKKEASQDFAESRVYQTPNEMISVSRRFILLRDQFKMIDIEKIKWIFAGYDVHNKYEGKHYTHSEREYFVAVDIPLYGMYKIYCPEELCSVLLDDIRASCQSVVTGYSQELHELYKKDRENFRDSAIYCAAPDTEPYGPMFMYDDYEGIGIPKKYDYYKIG